MPWASKAQRKFMWANHPTIAKKMEKHAGKTSKKLPEHVKKSKKK